MSWIEKKALDAISRDHKLSQQLLTWKITIQQLRESLKKQLPEMKIVDDELIKIKNAYASMYDDLIKQGKVWEDWVLRLATERQAQLAWERATGWATVWAFRTQDLIKNSKWVLNTIKDTWKRLNIKKVDWKYTWADPDIIKAQQAVDDIYNSIITDPNKITQDQLLRFHQAVKNKINFKTESTTFNNALKNFSDDISKFTDDILWSEYVAAKQVFRETAGAIDDFSVLINKWKWTIKENLRSTIGSLKEPRNQEKLETLSKAFWTDKKQFLQYLDDIAKWSEAEKAVEQLSRQTSISWFLKSITREWSGTSKISKDIQRQLRPELEKLLQKEQFAKLREKLLWTKFGWTELNIKWLSNWDIEAIRTLSPDLANKLSHAKLLEDVWISIWLSGGMNIQNFAKTILFRDAASFAKWLSRYEGLKSWTSKITDNIIKKFNKWETLSQSESSLLKEFVSKLMIYWNIEDDIYEWITE